MTTNTDASTIEMLLADGTLQAVIHLRELAETTGDADTRKSACHALYLLSKKRVSRRAAAHALYLLTQSEVPVLAAQAESTTQAEPVSSTIDNHMPWAWNTPDTKKVSITTTKPRKPFDYSIIKVVGFAIVMGFVLANGIVGFMNRYQSYQTTVSSEKVHTLMTQAAQAYSNQEYANAAALFEQALAAKPAASDLIAIQTSLGYTYVQLARQAKATGNTQQAVEDYNRAVAYTPDYGVAHEELSVLKESLQDVQGARVEREAAQGSASTQQPPAALQPPAVSLNDSPAMVHTKSEQASQLLKEGDQLLNNNDISGALRKWHEARDAAPGLPEQGEAQQRIDKYDGLGGG